MGMPEAGERQPEVIEQVIERLTRDGNAERACVGEVGQTQTTGLVLLAEDHVLFGAVKRSPGIDAPLQRASDVRVEVGMPSAQFVQHAADTGRSLQGRNDLGVPNRTRADRRRPLGAFFCDGGRESPSIRYALAFENPALAAAALRDR